MLFRCFSFLAFETNGLLGGNTTQQLIPLLCGSHYCYILKRIPILLRYLALGRTCIYRGTPDSSLAHEEERKFKIHAPFLLRRRSPYRIKPCKRLSSSKFSFIISGIQDKYPTSSAACATTMSSERAVSKALGRAAFLLVIICSLVFSARGAFLIPCI